jgi:tellurite resistance protein TerC
VPGLAAVPDGAVERARPGALMLTPLALALILVETTDLIFAVDSIRRSSRSRRTRSWCSRATCSRFWDCGSLYFALSDMVEKFRFLKVSLAMVLAVVGLKMLLAEPLKAALGPGFNIYLLVVVLVILVFGILASIWTGPAPEREVSG